MSHDPGRCGYSHTAMRSQSVLFSRIHFILVMWFFIHEWKSADFRRRLSGMTFSCSWPQTRIYSVSIITKWIEFEAVILCRQIKHVFVFEPWPLNSHWPLLDGMFLFLCAWRCKIVFYSDLWTASFSHCVICGLCWHPSQCCPSKSKLPSLQVPVLCSFPNLMLFSSHNKALASVSFGMFHLPAE